jgi:RNA polymerase sigma-70 factor (TIGR02960 family)
MGMTGLLEDVHMTGIDEDADVAAARSGDEASFGRLVERHRRELHVHCYRMIGSFTDAEDLVQETFLRAWRHRNTFEGAGFRAWLYRIATNACLDAIRRNKRQLRTLNSFAEVPWLQPYPDRLLDEVAPRDAEPDAVAVARETIELGFLATIQLLPGQQRAVFILRDVLGWSAAETAELLETSAAAANSALQRARATMRGTGHGRLPERSQPANDLSVVEQALLAGYVDAHSRCDAEALAALVRDDVRVTMPPHPMCYQGRDSLAPLYELAFGPERMGDWRLVPTLANRQPAAGSYLRRPGDTVFRAFKLDVLRVEGDAIAEFTTFDAALFPAFGLPPTL